MTIRYIEGQQYCIICGQEIEDIFPESEKCEDCNYESDKGENK